MCFNSILPRSKLLMPQIWQSRSSLDPMTQIISCSIPTPEMKIFQIDKLMAHAPLDLTTTIKLQTQILQFPRTLSFNLSSCKLPMKPDVRLSSLVRSTSVIKSSSHDLRVLTTLSLTSLSHESMKHWSLTMCPPWWMVLMISGSCNVSPPMYFQRLWLVHFTLIGRLWFLCTQTKWLRSFPLCAFSSFSRHWLNGLDLSPWSYTFFRLRIFSKGSKASTFVLPMSLFLGAL